MPTLSPLATLVSTLGTVCQQAQQYQQLLSKNEAATRAVLIDPVLRALGWDTADLTMVEPEKMIDTAWRADYALLNKTGKIELLVEAKCLGSNLEKYSAVKQLLSYAFGFGVVRIIITDGISWHFYNDFKPADAQAEGQFNLLHEPLAHCALQLIRWLDVMHFGHSHPLPASPLGSFTKPVTDHIPDKATQKQTVLLEPLIKKSQPLIYKFTELAYLSTLTLAPGQKPTSLRLPDGSIKSINTWKDILLEVSRFLLLHKPSLTIPLPDKAGKKRYLLSATKPATGSSTPAHYQGKPIFIYTHYSAADCIANALYAEAQLPAKIREQKVAVAF